AGAGRVDGLDGNSRMLASVDRDSANAAFDDPGTGAHFADHRPFTLVAEHEVRTDLHERSPHRVAEPLDVRPRGEIDANACAVLACQPRGALRGGVDRRAPQRGAGEGQRLAREPGSVEVLAARRAGPAPLGSPP